MVGYLTLVRGIISYLETQNLVALALWENFVITCLNHGTEPFVLHHQAIHKKQLVPFRVTLEVNHDVFTLGYTDQNAFIGRNVIRFLQKALVVRNLNEWLVLIILSEEELIKPR